MSLLAVLSPAKALRFGEPFATERALIATTPRFPEQSERLARALASLPRSGLSRLMELSAELASLNRERFLRFDPAMSESDPLCRRALFAFNGDAYEGLSPETLPPSALNWLCERTRFLSGFYGVLRPSDLMRAYRLEMGRRPPGIQAPSLYAFWGDSIARALLSDARELGAGELVNLASEEYAKAALPHLARLAPDLSIIQTRFESEAPSGWKVVSFDAKRARGLFARHLAGAGAASAVEAARSFDAEGWLFETQARDPSAPLLFRKPKTTCA